LSIEYTIDAESDIDFAIDELVDGYGVSLASAFRIRLEAMLEKIASMPYGFSLVDPPFPRYPGLRVVAIKKFAARLIFYTPTETGILVVRVLLASSDWASAMGSMD